MGKTTIPEKTDVVSTPGNTNAALYRVGAAIAGLFSLVLYLRTMAADSSFWDSGEFIASAYTLGVPHSPGTPLYVLVGKVFSLLPIPTLSIAQRVNFLSAFCGAAGAFFVYVLVVRFLDYVLGKDESRLDAWIKVAGALVAALFITGSDTYWVNATEAEVYAMSNALMGFMTWLALKWSDNPRDARSTSLILLLFYLLALSVGFHLGTILAISGIFFFVIMTKEKPFSNLEFILACIGVGIFVADATLYRNGNLTLVLLSAYAVVLLWLYATKRRFPLIASLLFVLGLSVHLYLLIRSGHNPAIDEGDPENWRALYAVLRREQYPPMNVTARKATFLFQLEHFNRYFQAQFQMASAYVGKLNVGSLIPIGLGIWGMVDQFAKHRKTFIMLFVTLVIVSLGLIVFLNFSDQEVRERDYFYSPAFYYFAIYIGIGAASLLNELRNALLRRKSNPATGVYVFSVVLLLLPMFTVQHHYFTHDRSHNYTCPVYARNMLIGLDKDAILFTNGDNDTFPLWYIQEVQGYRTDVKVVNLSLLNTPWYIRQCRDGKPNAPIAWSDQEIQRVRPVPRKDGGIFMIRDVAVSHIIRTTGWSRPIYFAVTIPPETYEPYKQHLRMEGLAYRLVRQKGENQTDVAKLRENIFDKFDYSGILDSNWKRDRSLYLPRYTEHLIQNYAAAFVQLAYFDHQDSLYTEAARSLEIANQISPQMKAPVMMLGWYLLDAGDTVKAEKFYKDAVAKDPQDYELIYRFAGFYERVGQIDKALDLVEQLMRIDPTNKDIMMTGAGMALRSGDLERAKGYLSNWLARYPDDSSVRSAIEDIDREIETGSQSP